jgi:hypothetical protein
VTVSAANPVAETATDTTITRSDRLIRTRRGPPARLASILSDYNREREAQSRQADHQGGTSHAPEKKGIPFFTDRHGLLAIGGQARRAGIIFHFVHLGVIRRQNFKRVSTRPGQPDRNNGG